MCLDNVNHFKASLDFILCFNHTMNEQRHVSQWFLIHTIQYSLLVLNPGWQSEWRGRIVESQLVPWITFVECFPLLFEIRVSKHRLCNLSCLTDNPVVFHILSASTEFLHLIGQTAFKYRISVFHLVPHLLHVKFMNDFSQRCSVGKVRLVHVRQDPVCNS